MDGKGECTRLCTRSRHRSSPFGVFNGPEILDKVILFTQIMGIAQGLHYLHNHSLGPIIHGDVKGVSAPLPAWIQNDIALAQCPDI